MTKCIHCKATVLSTSQPEQSVSMRAALERSIVAIDDWLHLYASEHCNAERVEEAETRIGEHGTLWYIANVQEQNRAALAATPSGTQGALALYLNEVQPVDGRVQINITPDELSVLRRLIAAGGEAMPDPNYKWGMDYGKDLLKDINQLAHAAGTGGLHRDMLQRAYREIRRLTPAADIPPCPVCHAPYHLEGAERYWEARWRDEKAENDRLRAAASPAPGESEDEPGPISGRYGRQRRPLSAANRDDLQESAKLLATPAVGGEVRDIGNYVQHHQDCDVFDKLKRTCTCGLSEVLAKPAQAAVGGEDDAEIGKQISSYIGKSGIDAEDVAYIRNLIQPASPLRERQAIAKAAQVVVDRVNNYDDRTSPEDWPDALLITSEELHSELMRFAEDIAASIPEQPAAETVLEQSERLDGTIMQTVRLADGSEIVREQPAADPDKEC